MFMVRKIKKKSSARDARSSAAVHTAEEHADRESSESEGHGSDARASEGGRHVCSFVFFKSQLAVKEISEES